LCCHRYLGDGYLGDGYLGDGYLGDGYLGDGYLVVIEISSGSREMERESVEAVYASS